MKDMKTEMYSLLKKMLDVFEKECCISCSRCHELRDEIAALLGPSDCVQQKRDCQPQAALRLADETQRRSVWHAPDEVPQIPAGKPYVRLVFLCEDDGCRVLLCDRFYRFEIWKVNVEIRVVKWMYFDDLEAL